MRHNIKSDKKIFISNVFIMTGAFLAIRTVSMCFNVYISKILGAELIGLYHLIFSAFSFAVTFSLSGTSLAATRLISENRGEGKTSAIVIQCITVSIFTSCTALILLNIGAEYISLNLLCDLRCVPALKILSLGLPAMAISSVIRGCLIAENRVGAATLSQITEELVSIAVTVFLLKKYIGTQYAYMPLILGLTASEVIACAIDTFFYIVTRGIHMTSQKIPYKNILQISVPVALASYLRSALVTSENILIPARLKLFGVKNAVAEYGIVKGMSMPVMLFPTVIITSVASLLIPELAKRNAQNRKNGIKYVADNAIEYTMIFAAGTAACLFIYSKKLGECLYANQEAGLYILYLALLAIPMYLDSITDSMLKGLNEQVASLKINIIDSVLRVIFIFTVLPKFGIKGYIAILYVSEILNLAFSFDRLAKCADIHFNLIRSAILPFAAAVISAYICLNINVNLVCGIITYAGIYALLVCIFMKIERILKISMANKNKMSYN